MRLVLRFIDLALILTIGLIIFCWNYERVFISGNIYFVDADCYARMNRVQQWHQPIKFHAFENAPFGTVPHTTAPMDMLIASLAVLFKLCNLPNSLDLAGAFISPILGCLFLGILWFATIKHKCRYPILLLASVSPMMAHCFSLGRPDHQSLILLLVASAWILEMKYWETLIKKFEVLSTFIWALALWVSLFEPLILLIITFALRFIVIRSKALPNILSIVLFIISVALTFYFEGWRMQKLPNNDYFLNWCSSIGELQHASFKQLFQWIGWLIIIVPFMLIYYTYKKNCYIPLGLAILNIILISLSLWHVRWGYFLALSFLLSLSWILHECKWKALYIALFIISLWPLAKEWDYKLYPSAVRKSQLLEYRIEAVLLRKMSNELSKEPKDSIILAPWWLSPAIAYWSKQSCVAGSSHQSLPGIIASAQFYTANNSYEALNILQSRAVNFVVAYEPSRIITNSAQILGIPTSNNCIGRLLYLTPYNAPHFLHLYYVNKYFKVFKVSS